MQNNDGSGYNGNGRDPEKEDESSNVIRMPTLAERDKMRREQDKLWRREYKKQHKSEPFINLPPVTKYMMLALIISFAITHFVLDPVQRYEAFMTFGFVPGYYSGALPFGWPAIAGLFTYILLHGSVIHLLMNTVMLAAFGTGVERWIGGKRMFVLFILCSFASTVVHFLFNPSSVDPVVGASGGLSGLFAAILLMMQQKGFGGTGKYGIWPFVIIWIGISVLFGMVEAPGGGTVAWAAHVGGFLAGFIFLKPVLRIP